MSLVRHVFHKKERIYAIPMLAIKIKTEGEKRSVLVPGTEPGFLLEVKRVRRIKGEEPIRPVLMVFGAPNELCLFK